MESEKQRKIIEIAFFINSIIKLLLNIIKPKKNGKN